MGEILILGHKILCDLALASLWNQLSPLALTDSALATWSPCVSLNLSSTLLLEGCFTCCIFLKCFSSIWLHGLLSDFIQFCFHVISLESFPEHPIEKGTLSSSTPLLCSFSLSMLTLTTASHYIEWFLLSDFLTIYKFQEDRNTVFFFAVLSVYRIVPGSW